jgi:hypothetical protein
MMSATSGAVFLAGTVLFIVAVLVIFGGRIEVEIARPSAGDGDAATSSSPTAGGGNLAEPGGGSRRPASRFSALGAPGHPVEPVTGGPGGGRETTGPTAGGALPQSAPPAAASPWGGAA